MKKVIIVMIFILSFFIFKYAFTIVNCNRIYKTTETELMSNTAEFNDTSKIKYNFLSSRLKKYISKEEFQNIKTWEQAYQTFENIPQQKINQNKINRYSFKYIISYKQNEITTGVSYSVTFINTFFGMKIDYIKIQLDSVAN